METAYKKLEGHLPSAVEEVMTAEKKWSDVKIIHSMLQDVKGETGLEITSADAERAMQNFLGQGGAE